MIRTVNFLFIAITGLMCLGLYRVAEAARVATASVDETQRAITREQNALIVLQAEWAHLTQPGRVAALAARHLTLTDKPAVELSSLTSLPRRGDAPLVPENNVRDAKIVVPASPQRAQPHPAAPVAPAETTATSSPSDPDQNNAVPVATVALNTGA